MTDRECLLIAAKATKEMAEAIAHARDQCSGHIERDVLPPNLLAAYRVLLKLVDQAALAANKASETTLAWLNVRGG